MTVAHHNNTVDTRYNTRPLLQPNRKILLNLNNVTFTSTITNTIICSTHHNIRIPSLFPRWKYSLNSTWTNLGEIFDNAMFIELFTKTTIKAFLQIFSLYLSTLMSMNTNLIYCLNRMNPVSPYLFSEQYKTYKSLEYQEGKVWWKSSEHTKLLRM